MNNRTNQKNLRKTEKLREITYEKKIILTQSQGAQTKIQKSRVFVLLK